MYHVIRTFDTDRLYACKPDHRGLSVILWTPHVESALVFDTEAEAEAAADSRRQLADPRNRARITVSPV